MTFLSSPIVRCQESLAGIVTVDETWSGWIGGEGASFVRQRDVVRRLCGNLQDLLYFLTRGLEITQLHLRAKRYLDGSTITKTHPLC